MHKTRHFLSLALMAFLLCGTTDSFAQKPGKDDLIIRGTNYANWWLQGETVCFKANKPVPADKKIHVTVKDVDGTTVHSDALDADDFNAKGWNWKPPHLGYYEATFLIDNQPVKDGYSIRMYRQDKVTRKYSLRGKADIPFNVHPFAIGTKTRPVNQISRLFSTSPHYDRYKDFLPLSRLIGFRSIRVHYVDWSKIEKTPGNYDWSVLDDFMDMARKYGYDDADIVLNLMGTPQWISTRPDATWVNTCIHEYKTVIPKDMNTWKNFIQAVMKRYPKVTTYELWNEPHLIGQSCFWADSVENFVALMKVGYEAVKEINPNAIVWLGGIGNRYLPFYREFVKLGGDKYFDVLPMHGSWPKIAMYRQLEKERELPNKPWVSSEWHAMLLRCATTEIPSEQLQTRNMVLDFLFQVSTGVMEVDLFCILNAQNYEKECLPEARKINPSSASHVSGLFRRTPFIAPRFQAVAWHTLSNEIVGKLMINLGYKLDDDQRAIHLQSDAGHLLLLWNQNDKQKTINQNVAEIIKGETVRKPDGSPTTLDASSKLNPETFYIVSIANPDKLKKLAKYKHDVLTPTDVKPVLSHKYRAHYSPKPIFDDNLTPLPGVTANIPINVKGNYETTTSTAGNISAAYAAALTPDSFQLLVTVKDKKHAPTPGKNPWHGDSVQFAIDTTGFGRPNERIEIVMADDPQNKSTCIFKNYVPLIGGDLPGKYTPLSEQIVHCKADVSRKKGTTTYKLILDRAELFPLNTPQNATFRFSILVNNNDGNGRAYYLQWATGIGSTKSPADYGDLHVKQPNVNLLANINVKPFSKSNEATLTKLGEGHYKAEGRNTAERQGTGFNTYLNSEVLLPNASYKLSFKARGTARLQVVAFMAKKRFDFLGRTPLQKEWRSFEIPIEIPGNATGMSLSIFDWEAQNIFFEIKDLELKPY